ncbi:ABC transporter permease [Aquibacillus rhizosphaerae]|uniref:ABC transporter permease n=1 Tax=Aquibacillus rhizosphaerae TaxID=3051431 RepID=A0ABT7LAU8_9BACI|nr:ABC transporter permease [Aquibacillus sp. LR5S19]MDL4842994.1 ABC transporter permease [Aquibacillus sp. LR5S19]
MKSILLLQLQRLRREPGLVIWMFVMTIGFVLLLGGFGMGKTTVPVYFGETLSGSEQENLINRLNESDTYAFEITDEDTAIKKVALGEIPHAIKAMKSDYQIVIAADNPDQLLLDQYVKQIYAHELRLQAVEASADSSNVRAEIERNLDESPITLTNITAEEANRTSGYDQKNHYLFGMTLFFSIYTIIFSLGKVAEEKRTGTWNRVILSPVRKWQVYIGHLCYAFMIGFVQILAVFLCFKYVFDFYIGDDFGAIILTTACYTFAIVALGMLMLGLVKSMEQLNALVPIVSVSMAMIGGAYWPIEAVTNSVILAISKLLPITYAMDALKEVVMYNQGIVAIAESLSILLVIGVLCMGVGINLMERKA